MCYKIAVNNVEVSEKCHFHNTFLTMWITSSVVNLGLSFSASQ
jgi:hypothetical protein